VKGISSKRWSFSIPIIFLLGLIWSEALWNDRETVVAFTTSHLVFEDYSSNTVEQSPCVGGDAVGFPCLNVDLLTLIPLAELGAQSTGNDIWGWTDQVDGREYALVGIDNGTAFVDISTPEAPVYLGKLPSHTDGRNTWRDIKQYANHAFVVSEASGHGMQIFDLTQLRSGISPTGTFSETAHYHEIGGAHNIVINEESGFAFAVGVSAETGINDCDGGLHMIDIRDPVNPLFAGCFRADGETHDAQCVNYQGPDLSYQDREICFNTNEDTLTIVDVTNKANPEQLSRTDYVGATYAHQGWLTEDHHYFLLNDELDERIRGHNTRTYIWDVSNLDAPQMIGTYTASVPAIDHNLYVKGNYVYEANYRSGLRVLDISRIGYGQLIEIAYFDTYPDDDNKDYGGAWSSYPFFESGVVIIGDYNEGLFVVRPNLIAIDENLYLPLIHSQ